MKRLILASLLAVSVFPAKAEVMDASKFAQLHGQLLATTYLCREYTGIEHYQAARSATISDLSSIVPTSVAYEFVDKQRSMYDDNRKIDRGPNVRTTDVFRSCSQMINDLYYQIGAMKNVTFRKPGVDENNAGFLRKTTDGNSANTRGKGGGTSN